MHEHVEELAKLSQEFPELEIIVMTKEEVFTGDWRKDYKGALIGVEKLEYIENEEEIYVGRNDILDMIEEEIEEDLDFPEDLSNKEISALAEKKYTEMKDKKRTKEAIFVSVGV
jgi:hypothetical protein